MAVARKLASIQKILDILPHANADTLEIARVLGWKVCVKKGEFKVGDYCVYMEIDSMLPQKPEFEFLRSKGFRIKTVRLRGEVSQGIAFPLSILDGYKVHDQHQEIPYLEDLDVTELIGVVKYEPAIHFAIGGEIKGHFPEFLKKTDETRIQAFPRLLDRYKGERFYVTEKLDGSSMTVYFKDGMFGICSRNYELRETEGNALWATAKRLHLPEKLTAFGRNIAIQGELIGPGIQGNKYKVKEHQFRPFNAININEAKRIGAVELFSLCSALDLEPVPVIDFWFVLNHTVDDIVSYAEGKSALNSNTEREGVVIRYIEEKYDEDIGDLSFKVISPNFLLKSDE